MDKREIEIEVNIKESLYSYVLGFHTWIEIKPICKEITNNERDYHHYFGLGVNSIEKKRNYIS